MGFGPIGPPGDGTREDNLYSRLWRDHIPRTGCHTGGWDPSVPQTRRRPSRRRTGVGLRARRTSGTPSDDGARSTSDTRRTPARAALPTPTHLGGRATSDARRTPVRAAARGVLRTPGRSGRTTPRRQHFRGTSDPRAESTAESSPRGGTSDTRRRERTSDARAGGRHRTVSEALQTREGHAVLDRQGDGEGGAQGIR